MAYTGSTFRSPSYWIALVGAAVGFGAVVAQERRGSAARTPASSVRPYPRFLNESGFPLVVLGPPHAGLSDVLSVDGLTVADSDYLRSLPEARGALRDAGEGLFRRSAPRPDVSAVVEAAKS